MLFISSRSNADEVWVRDLTTGRERQVTHGGAVDATLSHDGSRLAYSTMESGRRSVWIVNIDGGPRSLLCADCSIPDDWAPDGKHLLLEKEVQSRLAIYDVSTGQEKELTAHPTWNLHRAHFSPDSQWVAFHTTTNSPNVRQIYVTRADRLTAPAEWVRVISDHGCHASWSPDGSFLYHFSNRDGAFCPWVQRIDPATKQPLGPPRAVLHLHNPRLRAAAGTAASNDVQAGYLYLTATEATGNIWMLDDTHE